MKTPKRKRISYLHDNALIVLKTPNSVKSRKVILLCCSDTGKLLYDNAILSVITNAYAINIWLFNVSN